MPFLTHAGHALLAGLRVEPRHRRFHRLAGNALPPVVLMDDPPGLGDIVEPLIGPEAPVTPEHAAVGDDPALALAADHEGAIAP